MKQASILRPVLAVGLMAVAGLLIWLIAFRTPSQADLPQFEAAGLPWAIHASTVGPSAFGSLRDVTLSLRDDARLPTGSLMELAVTLCESLIATASDGTTEVFRVTILLPSTNASVFAPAWVEGPVFLMAVRGDTCSHELR